MIELRRPGSLKKCKAILSRASARRTPLFLLVASAITLMLVNVYGEVKMNAWQGLFFGAVENRDKVEIISRCWSFVALVAVLLCFVVAYYFVIDYIKINLRTALANDFTRRWLKPNCSYRLTLQENSSLCPDQRIQEDIRQFTELTVDQGLDLLKSGFLILSFLAVLWRLSSNTEFSLFGNQFVVPGFMVWCAILYAAVGTLLTLKAGRPLITRNDEKYSREAEYRRSLARANEHAESIAFHRGEDFEIKALGAKLTNVTDTLKVLAFAKARLSYVAWGHGWLVTLMSVALAAPGYMQHKFDFGGIMVIVGAFGQVQSSMRWFVANYAGIADWRCLVNRLDEFDQLISAENLVLPLNQSSESQNSVGVAGLEIKNSKGQVIVDQIDLTLNPGQRTLIKGPSGCGKSSLLRSIAGLWPWIKGSICCPSVNKSAFMPQRPYFPEGSLRTALTYPNVKHEINDADLKSVLVKVNLPGLVDRLDEKAAWDKTLSLGQQQRLSFARMILAKPEWIFMDEATSALDDQNEELLMTILANELSSSAVLSVGHRASLTKFHQSVYKMGTDETNKIAFRRHRPRTPKRVQARVMPLLLEEKI